MVLVLNSIQQPHLFCQVFLLGPAALPAIAPVQNQELETERINFNSGLKANAQVIVVHLVEFRAGVQQTDMAGDGEEEIVVERRQS